MGHPSQMCNVRVRKQISIQFFYSALVRVAGLEKAIDGEVLLFGAISDAIIHIVVFSLAAVTPLSLATISAPVPLPGEGCAGSRGVRA